MSDYDKELQAASEAVKEAGKIIIKHFKSNPERWQKEPGHFVSEVDLAAEEAIGNVIKSYFPDDGIMSEEELNFGLDKKRFWIIDPLDGTMNYLRRLPFFSVSLALYCSNSVVVGAVYDPYHDELFTASAGDGAYLNDKRIYVGSVNKLVECCIATEYIGYLDSVKKRRLLGRLGEYFGNIRMGGSQAIDLAYTAAGRIDIAFLPRSNPWDMAAGSLLVEEAGGVVWAPGGYSCLKSGQITGGNHSIVRDFVEEILELEYIYSQ
ncbi:MAG: inositol monophosphatase family protein [Bacillota bacterium]